MPENLLAERVYDAFHAVIGGQHTPFVDLPDGGEEWFAIVNAKDEILGAPDVVAPFVYELTEPKILRTLPSGKTLSDASPDQFTIRAPAARDICHPEWSAGGKLYHLKIVASVIGARSDWLDTVIDPVDVEVMTGLINHCGGRDATDIVSGMLDLSYYAVDHLALAIRAAVFTLAVEDMGKHLIVQTRTLGKIKLGPYRYQHDRVYEDGRHETDEWSARIESLALACGTSVGDLMGGRVEDVDLLWQALDMLKKKSRAASTLRYLQRIAAMSSGSESKTSIDGPSTS